MSLRATFLPTPVPALADPAPNTVTLLADPSVPGRVWGVFRVTEPVAGAPRPAARGLVLAFARGGDVDAFLPFRESVFYSDDESVSGDVRTGWFVVDVDAEHTGGFLHAFLGLATPAVLSIP